MSIQIQTPNITATGDAQRLRQIQSYLYRMAQQLQWAFDSLETGGIAPGTAVSSPARTGAASVDPASNFSALKSLNSSITRMFSSSASMFPKEARFFPEELQVLVQSTRENSQSLSREQDTSLLCPTSATNFFSQQKRFIPFG